MIRVPGVSATGEQPPTEHIDVVLNWFEELKSRAPVQ